MNTKFLVRWVFDVPAIIAFGFVGLFYPYKNNGYIRLFA
jgi:hypothetical protein